MIVLKCQCVPAGFGHSEKDAQCMSVYDFATGTELMSVELDNPNNFTYRCVYYD